MAEIEASVGQYGGFYIARYEAGLEGEEDTSSSTSTSMSTSTSGSESGETIPTDGSLKPLSQAGKKIWRYISREEAITVSKAMIDQNTAGVKSTLISGAAWDTTLQWMVNASDNKNKEPNLGYDENSLGKGWDRDVAGKNAQSPIIHSTGYFAVNNIYDMAGNVFEFTTENCDIESYSSFAVSRGGSFYHFGYEFPAAYRSWESDGSDLGIIGFRVVLYK